MSDLTVSSKTTPYGTKSTAGCGGVSSTTSRSRVSSSTVKKVTGSSTTSVTKTTGAITSSTTASYGASSTQSSVRITSSTTASTTTKTTGATSSTTTKTGSTTVGSSSTPSTTVKSTGATSSTTTKTTGTTSSTTPKTSQGVSSTTPNINRGICSETVKELSKEQNIKNIINVINMDLEDSVKDKMNDMMNKILSVTDSVRVFDFKVDNPMMYLEYYADIKGTKGNGQIRAEFAQDILEMMKQVPSLDNVAVNAGKSGCAIVVREGQLWIEYTNGGATTKVNMNKMMSGICNVVYENTQVLSEDKNGKVEATVGMEINIMLDKSTSTKFVKDYEVAYNTYLKNYAEAQAEAEANRHSGRVFNQENAKEYGEISKWDWIKGQLKEHKSEIIDAGIVALVGVATYYLGPFGAGFVGVTGSFIK